MAKQSHTFFWSLFSIYLDIHPDLCPQHFQLQVQTWSQWFHLSGGVSPLPICLGGSCRRTRHPRCPRFCQSTVGPQQRCPASLELKRKKKKQCFCRTLKNNCSDCELKISCPKKCWTKTKMCINSPTDTASWFIPFMAYKDLLWPSWGRRLVSCFSVYNNCLNKTH